MEMMLEVMMGVLDIDFDKVAQPGGQIQVAPPGGKMSN